MTRERVGESFPVVYLQSVLRFGGGAGASVGDMRCLTSAWCRGPADSEVVVIGGRVKSKWGKLVLRLQMKGTFQSGEGNRCSRR